MRPKPTDLSRPKILQSPAAAAAAASVTAAYALSKNEKLDSTIAESNSKRVESNISGKDLKIEIDAIKEEKHVLELSLAEVREENSKLGGAIEEINSTHAELAKVFISEKIT